HNVQSDGRGLSRPFPKTLLQFFPRPCFPSRGVLTPANKTYIGSFLTWVRNKGFITLKVLSLLFVLFFKYSLGLRLGTKRIARLIKSIYQSSCKIKKLFKWRKKT
ncbi:MAG: hypothetical protein QXV69_10265, partial [Sulfolobaceae archaeon]